MRSSCTLGIGIRKCAQAFTKTLPSICKEAPQTLPGNLHQEAEGMTIVKHNDCFTSRHENTIDFGDSLPHITRVVQTTYSVHVVKTRVLMRNLKSRTHLHFACTILPKQ